MHSWCSCWGVEGSVRAIGGAGAWAGADSKEYVCAKMTVLLPMFVQTAPLLPNGTFWTVKDGDKTLPGPGQPTAAHAAPVCSQHVWVPTQGETGKALKLKVHVSFAQDNSSQRQACQVRKKEVGCGRMWLLASRGVGPRGRMRGQRRTVQACCFSPTTSLPLSREPTTKGLHRPPPYTVLPTCQLPCS